jgi:GNAT superfamily N-acetyltransferase
VSKDLIDYSLVRTIKLTGNTFSLIEGFDCGIDDLNEFLSVDALNYLEGKLTVTYLLEYESEIMAFFCLSNADIKVNEEDMKAYDKLGKHLPNYPAMLIGRLSVKKSERFKGFGSVIIGHVVGRAIEQSGEVGCRYVAVDAKNDEGTIKFYEKNGFKRLSDGQKRTNVPMYLDLLKIKG